MIDEKIMMCLENREKAREMQKTMGRHSFKIGDIILGNMALLGQAFQR